MCFSATASFTASAALGLAGAAAMAKVTNKRELPIALIPIIFAIQQVVEGLIWLSLTGGDSSYTLPLTYIFLFFATFWWPIFVPLTTYLIENKKSKKKIMLAFCVAGVLIGVFYYASFLLHPTPGRVVNSCIQYSFNTPYPIVLVFLYAIATLGAGFFSSKRIVRWFSALVAVSAIIAWKFYALDFASVWCFFAAVLSLMIFFYFVEEKKLPKKWKVV